jgi:hypothetical protein
MRRPRHQGLAGAHTSRHGRGFSPPHFEIHKKAERRLGEMLKKQPKAKGQQSPKGFKKAGASSDKGEPYNCGHRRAAAIAQSIPGCLISPGPR